MKGYVTLAIAIIAEVFGTTMLKVSNGFSILLPSIGVAFGFLFAFYFLSISLKTLPLSLAYAIWSGVGTALTAFIGILIWNEAFNTYTFLGLFLIISGVVLLNMKKKEQVAKVEG